MRGATAGRTKVLCAPGRGESFDESFGNLSWREEVDILCVDFTPRFAKLLFSEQTALFDQIIRDRFWSENALLLGRSFGSWILLNTLLKCESVFPGTVVLLSSVLGFGGTANFRFIAPRGWKFWDEAMRRTTSPAKRLVLVHAEDDDQCPIDHARKLCDRWQVELMAFHDGGHQLATASYGREISEIIHRRHFVRT